jgi:type II secretion system-associated lipoprotein
MLSLLMPGCRSAFVPAKQIEAINQQYEGKKFRVREDLYFQQNDKIDKNRLIHKKGTIVVLKFESSDDWVRVRTRDVTRNEEQNPGDVFLFLVEDPEKELRPEQVLETLKRILDANLAPVP